MEAIEFDVEALAADAAFRRWVIAPDADSNAHWQQFLVHYPERRSLLEQARRLVQAHPAAYHVASEAAIARMWAVIERNIQ